MARLPQLNEVVGLNAAGRFNRAGKIHTGLPRPSGQVKWGKETDIFVLELPEWWKTRGIEPDPQRVAAAEAVARVYGRQPKMLEAIFLSDDRTSNAPNSFKKYGSGGFPVCRGNGQICHRWIQRGQDDARQEVLDCPTPEDCEFARDEKGVTQCRMIVSFQVLLPLVDLWNTYQIDTTSVNALFNYDSWSQQVAQIAGRVRGVPVILSRPTHTSVTPKGGGSIHFPVKFQTPSNDRLKALMSRYLSVKSFFVQAEAKVQGLIGRADVGPPAADDAKPEGLYPAAGSDAPTQSPCEMPGCERLSDELVEDGHHRLRFCAEHATKEARFKPCGDCGREGAVSAVTGEIMPHDCPPKPKARRSRKTETGPREGAEPADKAGRSDGEGATPPTNEPPPPSQAPVTADTPPTEAPQAQGAAPQGPVNAKGAF